MDTISEVDKGVSSSDSPNLVSETALKNLHDFSVLSLPSSVLVILSSPSFLKEEVGLEIGTPDIATWTDSHMFW
jgi:hypothetical protein